MAKKDSTLYLIGVSLLLAFLDYFGWLIFLKTPVEKVILPTKQTVFKINIAAKSLEEFLFHYPQLRKIVEEDKRREKENQDLALKVKLLTEENNKLRYQLVAPLAPSYQFIPAPVIAISRYLEIAAGEREGVKKDAPVVDGAVFLGKIVSLSARRSQVRLPSDPESLVPAKTSRGSRGVVVGRGGAIILEKVLQKDPLILNDQVLTSGEGGYPANLLIGTIVHISSEDVSTYKEAKVKPALDYDREEIVFVVSSL